MARPSAQDIIIRKNRATFDKCETFKEWSTRHLRDKTNEDKFKAAFEAYLKDEEATRLRSDDGDQDVSRV